MTSVSAGGIGEREIERYGNRTMIISHIGHIINNKITKSLRFRTRENSKLHGTIVELEISKIHLPHCMCIGSTSFLF